ncbi:MAG: PIG-L family deacetylase [Eubacteriales bacterium]|nr:PIG-L family deacetylase [Eubacteriales bacterium]
MKYNRILAIGGHIGDMELTCGGVLATCAAAGGHIATLALTGGEKGNPPDQTPEQYRVQKVQEAERFAQMLGGAAYVLPYADGLLPDDDTVRFQVCDIIRREKPDLIVTHHGKSMHKDHAACHRIVKDAWFYAAIGGFRRELPPHFGQLRFAENWEDAQDFRPYQYLEVSQEGFRLWQEAVQTHWFVTGSKSFPYFEYYSHLKRLRGIEARKTYAEAFMTLPEDVRLVESL